jgi:hypothetical protein
LVALGVCELHREAVMAWGFERSVSDGFVVDIEDAEDLVHMGTVGSRYEPARDRRVSNLEGGVALLAS